MKNYVESKKLVEEESKLEEIRHSIDEINSDLRKFSDDKKDSIFWKKILASSIFGSVLLVDVMACTALLLNPMINNAVLFILEASVIGYGISGLLATIIHFDKKKLVRKITDYKIEIGRLSKEENEIKEELVKMQNRSMEEYYDYNQELEITNVEDKEKVKIKTLGSK